MPHVADPPARRHRRRRRVVDRRRRAARRPGADHHAGGDQVVQGQRPLRVAAHRVARRTAAPSGCRRRRSSSTRPRCDPTIDIELPGDASMIGWDIVALGRRGVGRVASRRAALRRRSGCARRAACMGRTHAACAGGDALLGSPIGLAGQHVFGCLWAAGPQWSEAQLERCANIGPAQPRADHAPDTDTAAGTRARRHVAGGAACTGSGMGRELRPLTFAAGPHGAAHLGHVNGTTREGRWN